MDVSRPVTDDPVASSSLLAPTNDGDDVINSTSTGADDSTGVVKEWHGINTTADGTTG